MTELEYTEKVHDTAKDITSLKESGFVDLAKNKLMWLRGYVTALEDGTSVSDTTIETYQMILFDLGNTIK